MMESPNTPGYRIGGVVKLLVGFGLFGSAFLGLAGCTSTSEASAQSQPQQTYTMEVLTGHLSAQYGIIGPDARGHDTFSPSAMTVKAGVPVQITVWNYDEGSHSFTVSSLGINKMINAGPPKGSNLPPTKTVFTVTFKKTGLFRFYCVMPCDAGQGNWAMGPDRNGHGPSQDGFMAGYVNVIA